MKRKCVLGVLKTVEGLIIKEEMLGWLNEKYDVTLVEVDPPNDIEFELPFIKKACEVAIESNEPVLYLHTKGAGNKNSTQPIVRNAWQYAFTKDQNFYFDSVNTTVPTAASLFVDVVNKVCWYNAFVFNVAAAKQILTVLKPHTDRYWFEQGMLTEANVDVVGNVESDNYNKAYTDLLQYAAARNLFPPQNTSTEKYSVLVYNFNNYEIMREPSEVDPECEYIYVTDNPALANNVEHWKVIVDQSLNKLSVFDKCYAVRFNLFRYAHTPVCIYVDGSIRINKSLRKIYDDFIASGADLGVNIHPVRNRVDVEYLEWIRTRGYSVARADKCLNAFKSIGYDVDELGLCQGTMRICKNTQLNATIDLNVLDVLKQLGTKDEIERLDQTVYTVILTLLHKQLNFKVFPISQQVLQSNYMTWCFHGTPHPIPWNTGNEKSECYLFGKLEKLYKV